MCLLTYFPTGVQPDCEALYNGTLTNDDGQGFAIVTSGRLIVRRGMSADDTVDLFAKMRRRFPDGPALYHSRFGTGGSYSRANCHPFRFRGDRRTVVAHNGILPAFVQPGRKDPRCDTRIAADTLLPDGFGHLGNAAARARLAKWVGNYNKLVILTVNPAYRQASYIINEAAGVWDDGVWYSNYDYLPLESPAGSGDRCSFCESTESALGFCIDCGLCADCSQPWERCQCYNPEVSYAGGEDFTDDVWWR